MDHFSAKDAGETAPVLEIERDSPGLEKSAEPSGEVPSLPVPVGEKDDRPVALHERLRGLRKRLPAMHERDLSFQAETGQG